MRVILSSFQEDDHKIIIRHEKISIFVELIANYMRYLNFTIDPLIATFLLIGLEIDTNNFKNRYNDRIVK